MGMLPAFCGTEFPQENDQGTLTGWFYGTLGSDPVKIIGLNQPGGKDGVAAFEGAGARIVWTLTVISPEEVRFGRAVATVLPAAAAVMGVSAQGCRVIGQDRWLCVGD